MFGSARARWTGGTDGPETDFDYMDLLDQKYALKIFEDYHTSHSIGASVTDFKQEEKSLPIRTSIPPESPGRSRKEHVLGREAPSHRSAPKFCFWMMILVRMTKISQKSPSILFKEI